MPIDFWRTPSSAGEASEAWQLQKQVFFPHPAIECWVDLFPSPGRERGRGEGSRIKPLRAARLREPPPLMGVMTPSSHGDAVLSGAQPRSAVGIAVLPHCRITRRL